MSAELCSAFTIARMFDLKVAEAATFADTLDGLDAGLYLVDADGRLIHANAAGQAILDVRDILHEIRGHLAARDPTINQTLRDVFMAAGQGDSALGASNMSHELPLLVFVARPQAGARDNELALANPLAHRDPSIGGRGAPKPSRD